MKKSVVRIICFCMVLISVLYYTNKVFKVKSNIGISVFTKFYALEKDTVDVLILGSSHAFMDINTGTLWDEYGMAAYVLGGAAQPMWNTYYYLKEALKYQTPKLIVLEGYTIIDKDFQKDDWIIANNYGLKWSKNKIDSIKESVPRERWSEFFWEYIQYHTRYKELSREDFFNGEVPHKTYKGFINLMNTTSLEAPDVAGITERGEIYEKPEKYYKMIIELAQSKNIPILVVISPYGEINGERQKIYNKAEDIACEYGVPFVNYNLLINEIGLDFSLDVADAQHLNYRGSQKYAKALGKYIKENFDIPNRKGDGKYQTWQDNAYEISVEIANQLLRETTDMEEIVDKISKTNYVLIASADGNCRFSEERLRSLCNVIGITAESGYEGIYYIDNDGGRTFHVSGDEERRYVRLDPHDLCMERKLDGDKATYVNKIVIDWIEYHKVKNGVNVVIYDKVTQSVADSFGINKDDDYNIVR